MKKIFCFLLGIIAIVNLYFFVGAKQVKSDEEIVKDISEKLIRFHVIANSDEEADQQLKIKVKDNIINYIFPKLKDSKSIDESRDILRNNNKQILKIAEKTIKENGYNYSVNSTLDRENFPEKNYGNITLPQGEYEAYRVIIGSGQGKNWWCVMFPPLCFVDVTKGQVSDKETEETMKRVLDNDEYTEISNKNDKNKIKIKFKIVEIIKDLIDK
ncbi:MAG: peptidase [Clostridiaceae bacterium]|uniref:Stage II sporulation protein R n=2 Tax=Clostridium intestinale TaxID=36845 RepID=U2NTN8_9CLOT|nr:stage II sporulation protein R [Clostridium intestinale]ERK32231.1 stage II sporulation protein R [Clostridium intestinale URNW]MDF2885597.1 peptidase [Clostridiaceae bacterium]QLY79251.1 stage II sporulation protein R [Clostridium intestinale]